MSDKARKFPHTLLIVDDSNADEAYFSIQDSIQMAEENAKEGLVATYYLDKVEKVNRLITRKPHKAKP